MVFMGTMGMEAEGTVGMEGMKEAEGTVGMEGMGEADTEEADTEEAEGATESDEGHFTRLGPIPPHG